MAFERWLGNLGEVESIQSALMAGWHLRSQWLCLWILLAGGGGELCRGSCWEYLASQCVKEMMVYCRCNSGFTWQDSSYSLIKPWVEWSFDMQRQSTWQGILGTRKHRRGKATVFVLFLCGSWSWPAFVAVLGRLFRYCSVVMIIESESKMSNMLQS